MPTTFVDWNAELLLKWTNFLKFLFEHGPGIFRAADSPLQKGLQYPELSLSIFMDNIKSKRHFLPDQMNRIHECSERWLQHPDKERVIFVETLQDLITSKDVAHHCLANLKKVPPNMQKK